MDDEFGGTPFQEISKLVLEVYGFFQSPGALKSWEWPQRHAASSVRGGFLEMTTLRNGYLPRSSLQHDLLLLVLKMFSMYRQCIAFSRGQVIRLVCLVIYAIWYLFSIQRMARCFQFDFHNISYFGMDGSTTDYSISQWNSTVKWTKTRSSTTHSACEGSPGNSPSFTWMRSACESDKFRGFGLVQHYCR